MARLHNTFEFVGKLNFGKEPAKFYEYDSGWTKKQLSVSINESQNNGVFLALEGGKSKSKANTVTTFTKKVFGEDGSKLVVDWDDRNSQSILNSVADFKKTIIDLTIDEEVKKKHAELRGEIYKLESKDEPTKEEREKLDTLYTQIKENSPHRYEFLHPLDAIEFIEKNGDKLKGKKFKAKGSVEVSYWNGKFYTNYKLQTLELVSDDVKNKLSATVDLFFTKDVADTSQFEDGKVITYNTYILAYDNGHKVDKLFPYETVFNGSNYDFENPKHKAHHDVVTNFMTVEDDGVFHLPFEVKLISGAEEVEFSEANLTESQKMMIEAGFNTLDDFKTGKTFGDKKYETRLFIPVLKDLEDKGNFSSGAILSGYDEDALVYVPAESNYTPKPETKPEAKASNPIEFNEDDLPF